MAITIKRKPRESVESLLKRFTKAVTKSGVLIEARKRMYRDRPVSKRAKLESAIHRAKKAKEYEKLKKWGKI